MGMIELLLVILLLMVLLGTFPVYPYSRGWGYYPSGGLTVLLVVVLLFLFVL